MINGFIAGFAVILSSICGSLLGLIFKKITHKTNDMFLGYAAGIMFAAAFLGILPSAFPSDNIWLIIISILGVIIGAFLISVIDKFLPHIHFHDGHFIESEAKTKNTSKVLLLCIAIAIHNIPEGLATGISFSNGITNQSLLIGISMIIQKIPEGLIVMLPLLSLNLKKAKAFQISILVALMMVPGLILGVLFGALPAILNGFFNAFTFGAIIFVISKEVIPESHEHGYQKPATFALLTGILSVIILQLLLG